MEKDHLQHIGTGERIIIRWIVDIQDAEEAGLIWLTTKTTGGLL